MTHEPPTTESLLALYGRVQEQLQAEQKTTLAVIQARKSGASWSMVATQLGISTSQAWNRYHELDTEDPYQLPPDLDGDAPTA